jgi:hypothetical protein
MYEPRDVPLGKECGCVCPACHQPIYAKHCRAGKVTPHFAHAPGTNCTTGLETALHRAAKQLIEERAELSFPALRASIDIFDASGLRHQRSMEIAPAALRKLTGVRVEIAVGDFRPDLIVDTHELGEVIVEVAVTHFVDELKAKKFRDVGVSAIEIDISSLRGANFSELERVLFVESINTHWIYHPRLRDAENELHRSIQPLLLQAHELANTRVVNAKRFRHGAVSEQLRALAKERRNREQSMREMQHKELKRAKIFRYRREDEKIQILQRRLVVDELPAFLRTNVRGGRSFGVKDELVWQTTLFGGLVHQQLSVGNHTLRREYALDWLRHRFEILSEFEDSEQVAIWDYFDALVQIGALLPRLNGNFRIVVADLNALAALVVLRTGPTDIDSDFTWIEKSDWPGELQSRSLSLALRNRSMRSVGWTTLATITSAVHEAQPSEFCEWCETNLRLLKMDVLDYLVRAGFLRLRK